MSKDAINKLTVYKLKQAVLDSIEILSFKEVANGKWKMNQEKFHYRLFFHKSGPHTVGWLSVFQKSLKLDLKSKDIPESMTSGFILIVQVKKSYYAVTGGVGHFHLRKHLTIEPRFGIDLAQRILSLPELRGLAQRDTSGIVNTMDRIFRGPYNPMGDINNLKRVLTHVRGTLQKTNTLQATVGRSIQASDALTVNGSKTFDDIIKFLIQVDTLWARGKVKLTIPQLEYINKRTNSALLHQLELQLVLMLSRYNPDETHSLFLDNEDIGYLPDRVVRYELLHNRQKYEANTFVEVFEHVRDLISSLDTNDEKVEAFHRMNLRVYFDDENTESRSLSYFICGDIQYNNDVYFLNHQLWYRASGEFLNIMNAELDNIECMDPSKLKLKEWDRSKYQEEKDFNAAHKNLLVMDRNLVKVRDEKGGIEFCDLLGVLPDEIQLIHVKRETGAALRALFAQGFVSARLYSESEEFRAKIHTGKLEYRNEALKKNDLGKLHDLKKRHRREMKVIFAIFDDTKSHAVDSKATTTSEVLKGTLSTFAKVDLLDRVTTIRAMGYGVAVCRIKPYPKIKGKT